MDGLVEAGSIDQVDATNDLRYPWIKDESISDRAAYHPTNQGIDSSTSSITITVTGKGALSYDYKVSAEDYFDYLIVYQDNQIVHEYKTKTEWESGYVDLNEGTQVIRFEYKKDAQGTDNDDTVWLSNIRYHAQDKIAIMPEVQLYHSNDEPVTIKNGDEIFQDLDIDDDLVYILRLGGNSTESIITVKQDGVEKNSSGDGSYVLNAIEGTSFIQLISKKEGLFTTELSFSLTSYSMGLSDLIVANSRDFVVGSNDSTNPWVRDYSIGDRVAYYPTNPPESGSSITFEVTGPGVLYYDFIFTSLWDDIAVSVDNVWHEWLNDWDWGWQESSVILEKELQTVEFYFWRDWLFDDVEENAWLSNIRFVADDSNVQSSLTIEVNGGEYGSITLPEGLDLGVNQIDVGTELTLNATANPGAVFFGWVDGDNNFLSIDEEYTFKVFDDLTIAAVFGVAETYIARRNGQFYTESDGGLVEALQESSSGDVITLLKDYTLSKDVTVPAGVLFLLPYSEADVDGYTSTGFNPDGTSTSSSDLSRLYRTLTIPGNVNVTVDGTIMVNAVTGRPAAGHYDMDITGGYSEIILDGNIIVRDGGLLDVFGKVTGSGMIEALDGSSVGDLFVVRNWRGGTQAFNCYNEDIFPFNQYDLHNIETDLKIHSAASYYGNVKMYANYKYYYTRFYQFSQNDGLIKLAPNAYALKTFDTANGDTTITISGGAEEVGGSMEVAGVNVPTTAFFFPIDGHISFVLENGEYSINNNIKFLTGSGLEIKEDATLAVNTGGQLILYQEFNEGTPNVPTTIYPQRDPVKFILGGKLEIQGSFGGLIQADEAGKVEVGDNAILSVSSKEYFVDVPYTISTNLSCANDDGLKWYYYLGSNEEEAILVPEDCQGIDYINLNTDPDEYKGHTFILKANGQ